MTEAVEQVQASLAQARDAQVARVVAMVDAMPERGAADALIAPLRPRLAQLRPVRPPGFLRLLFMPLNPVIMPVAEWRRSGVGVPRPALAPLGAAIRAALPDDIGRRGEAEGAEGAAPAPWPEAAAVVAALAAPPDWCTASGLSPDDFAPVAAIVAAVLAEAQAIERLARQRDAVDDADIRAILVRSRLRGEAALDSVVLVLLARLAVPARVAALATEATGGDGVTGRAIDRLAASLGPDGAETADVREAAMEAARVAAMLDALDGGASPERRARLEQVRRDADALSRRSFGQAVGHTLALAQAAMTASCDDSAVGAIEACARDLRRLETAGRRLGGGGYYDAQLAEAAALIRTLDADLGLADRVRLTEILVGPEQATALLVTRARPSPSKG